MSHDNSEEDNQSVISSSGSEEYQPKLNEILDIDSDCSTEDMNYIGQQPTNAQTPLMPMNMMQGVVPFPLPPPVGLGMNLQETHETSDDILEFMTKQSKIIGSNMMEEMKSPVTENGMMN